MDVLLVHTLRLVMPSRSLKVQRTTNLCGVGQSRDWLALYKALQRDLRSQVIYR